MKSMLSAALPALLSATLLLAMLASASAAPASKTKGKATGSRVAAAPAAPVALQGDAVLGREKADAERCMECHGVDGNGQGHGNGPEGKFPKLAGQSPAYILKQIQDFRSGARKHDQMQIMARSVSDEDVIDIAAYFASQPRMTRDRPAEAPLGRALYEQGDAARGIVACASCHGPDGQGIAAQPLVPIVGGQEWRYLDKQLRDWRAGERRNSADGLMNQLLQPLTDADIEALTLYLAGS